MIIGHRAAKCKCSLELLLSILKINLLALNGRRDLERAKMERNGTGHLKKVKVKFPRTTYGCGGGGEFTQLRNL